MPTKKIVRCEFWLRPYGNTDEARAMLHLDAHTKENELIWEKLTEEVKPKASGWKYQELYDALDKMLWCFKQQK